MNFRVHLIACGGTALTLLNIKESTKDITLLCQFILSTKSCWDS